MKPKIGITMGDPGGIGPEVSLKSLFDPEISSLLDPLLVGIPEVFERVATELNLPLRLSLLGQSGAKAPIEETPRKIPLVPCGELKRLEYGNPSSEGGEVSLQAIKIAARMALDGRIDAVVTAPISKYSLHLAGHSYPGHTELLSSLAGAKRYGMMLLSGSYRVVLVTTHLALREVAGTITVERVLGTIELTNSSLREHFGLEEPRIGVCGLNPHGGEGGIFGDEEMRVISPAASRAMEEGIKVEGPLPSDTLFTRWQEFDAIIAMYHDQGLIPLKLLGFGKGVNLTLGLPFVRTSPDHGTAFDIAGKGVADPGSMTEALKLAAELCTHV